MVKAFLVCIGSTWFGIKTFWDRKLCTKIWYSSCYVLLWILSVLLMLFFGPKMFRYPEIRSKILIQCWEKRLYKGFMHLYLSIYIHSSVLWRKIGRRILNPTPLLRTESDLHKLMLENFSQLPVCRLIESHATNSCHHFLLLGLSILTTKAA